MSFYYLGVASLLVALLVFILVPVALSNRKTHAQRQAISNPEIVKQRLQELDSEKRESLLSESDFSDAVVETKLHLAEELASDEGHLPAEKASTASIVFIGVFIFVLSSFVYYKVNHVNEVKNWELAKEKMPEMGQRIVVNADNSVTREELMNFALGLRTKLATQKDDPVGWLLLGRVLSTLRDFDGAIMAFNKSLEIQPNRVGAMFSLAQTLLVTDSEANILRAERLLLTLREMSPQDNSVLGLLAVAYTRKGDEQLAIRTWQLLKQNLKPGDPMMTTVNQQLAQLMPAELNSQADETGSGTQLIVTVTLSSDMTPNLPQSGFLFVFVQDADSAIRMPAAVVKQSLAGVDLTNGMTLTLSNSDAMLQEFNLSKIKNGRLIARISSDENVAQQEGDLQGEIIVPVVQGTVAEHQILINKEI